MTSSTYLSLCLLTSADVQSTTHCLQGVLAEPRMNKALPRAGDEHRKRCDPRSSSHVPYLQEVFHTNAHNVHMASEMYCTTSFAGLILTKLDSESVPVIHHCTSSSARRILRSSKASLPHPCCNSKDLLPSLSHPPLLHMASGAISFEYGLFCRQKGDSQPSDHLLAALEVGVPRSSQPLPLQSPARIDMCRPKQAQGHPGSQEPLRNDRACHTRTCKRQAVQGSSRIEGEAGKRVWKQLPGARKRVWEHLPGARKQAKRCAIRTWAARWRRWLPL